jgi:fermentation-respiration switch protein FrsA (DUF1100 family)
MFAGMRPSLRRPLTVIALATAAALAAASGASAQTPTPFGHACVAQNGVRFCPTTDGAAGQTVNGVPSFDGVPLDVDVTLPATGNGPFPTIVMLHGWGGDKSAFESTSAAGGGTTTYHYNNIFFAQQGYAVINYTARGFGHSCGGGPTALHTGACAAGYIHLADTRYEVHDTQYLLGLLADEGIVKPGAIGVTGISYGGGQSLELAYLKNRVRTTSGGFVPWTSPSGKALSITAAYPRWEWSDLVDALLPNGRFLDTNPTTNGLSRSPFGVPIQSYINGLFASGGASGYYCGTPPASPCTDSSANLPLDFTEVTRGEPVDATDQAIANDIYANHSAYSLPLPAGGPAPLLLESGWTDDLFPPSQSLRVYNQLRPRYPVTLQLGDLGHSRGSNKATVNNAFQDQGAAFFDAYLRGRGRAPAPGSVEAFTQTCPATAPDGGPFTASTWAALHPASVTFGSALTQTVTATGDSQDGPQFDPIPQLDPAGTSDACKTITPGSSAGTAVYTTKSHGFTLLGLPTVTANIATSGLYGELDSRLYDVLPNGTERLISRGTYRLLDNQTGSIAFQLHGNGYYFAPGDTVKLELRGNDADYYRPSNDVAFTVRVSDVRISLPVAAASLRVTVKPSSARARAKRSFQFRVTTIVNGSTVPVAGARVALLGHSASSGSGGAATLKLALPHRGRFKATVSKSGYGAASATIHATAAARRPSAPAHHIAPAPSFTG